MPVTTASAPLELNLDQGRVSARRGELLERAPEELELDRVLVDRFFEARRFLSFLRPAPPEADVADPDYGL